MLGKLMDALGLGSVVEMQTAADLRPGRALLHGTVTAPAGIPAPVSRRGCVAFYYRASYRRASRLKGFQQELLRDALTYAPELRLRVDGVEVALEPMRNDDWGPDQHQTLARSGLDGFRGVETTIPDGGRVRAEGTLKRRGGDAWLLRLEKLHYDPPPKKSKKKPARKR